MLNRTCDTSWGLRYVLPTNVNVVLPSGGKPRSIGSHAATKKLSYLFSFMRAKKGSWRDWPLNCWLAPTRPWGEQRWYSVMTCVVRLCLWIKIPVEWNWTSRSRDELANFVRQVRCTTAFSNAWRFSFCGTDKVPFFTVSVDTMLFCGGQRPRFCSPVWTSPARVYWMGRPRS